MKSSIKNKNRTVSDKDGATPPLKKQIISQQCAQSSNREMLAVDQLKEKAEQLNLNGAKPKSRWDAKDRERTRPYGTIVETPNSYRTDPSRLSFLDFPAETRNQVYAYALTAEHILLCSHHLRKRSGYMCEHYGGAGRRRKNYESDACFKTLQALKQLNRVIRNESNSYYYANNKFVVCASWEQWPEDTWGLNMDFLADIHDSRMHLHNLTIKDSATPYTSEKDFRKTMLLLQQYPKLQSLDIAIHPVWLVKGGKKSYGKTSIRGLRVDFDIPNFANDFKSLVSLQYMHLRIVAKVGWGNSMGVLPTKQLCRVLEKEELEEEFKTALPNVHFTIALEGWD